MSQFSSLINMTHYLSKTQSSPNSFNIYILKEKPGLAGSGKFATNCSKQQLDRWTGLCSGHKSGDCGSV